MNIINQSVSLLTPPKESAANMKMIEFAGRNCYASQQKITEKSYDSFIRNLIKRGHEAPLEFGDLVFDITTSRAVLAELTRHRLMSFCVESQRYIDYAKTNGLPFIRPYWANEIDKHEILERWQEIMEKQEDAYLHLRSRAMTPESARGVLPNDMSVRVIVKANLREWRHFFDLRCAPAAYPQMRELALEMLRLAHSSCPCVFEDLFLKYNAEALQGEDRDGD